jgi:hypothetical protein
MQRTTVAMIALALLVAGCGSGGGSGTASSPSAPSETSPSPSSSAEQASALEGTWRTGTVTEADIEATLREADLEEWIKPLRALPASDPPVDSNVFILEIHAGAWDLYWEPNGGTAEELDFDASYEVDGDTVVVSHEGDSNTYRWSVDGDTLTLTWVDTTYGSHKGIPEEVFQTAFYMSGDFEKQV